MSPSISKELREAWTNFSNQQIIDFFKNKNINIQLSNSGNRHFKIRGKKRKVDLYATTGTVSANPVKRLNLKYCSHKEMMPERALERIMSLANFGY